MFHALGRMEEPGDDSYGRRRRTTRVPAGAPAASPATRSPPKGGDEAAPLIELAQGRPAAGRPAIRRVAPPLAAAKDDAPSPTRADTDADLAKESQRTATKRAKHFKVGLNIP